MIFDSTDFIDLQQKFILFIALNGVWENFIKTRMRQELFKAMLQVRRPQIEIKVQAIASPPIVQAIQQTHEKDRIPRPYQQERANPDIKIAAEKLRPLQETHQPHLTKAALHNISTTYPPPHKTTHPQNLPSQTATNRHPHLQRHLRNKHLPRFLGRVRNQLCIRIRKKRKTKKRVPDQGHWRDWTVEGRVEIWRVR